MRKNEIQEYYKIIIPNVKNIDYKGNIVYFNPENKNFENTSIGRFFNFNNFPFLDCGDNETNDFDYYSMPIMDEKNILPFATDPGGYFFCFDYRNSNIDPSIVLWIRDNPEGYDITKVADSFDEFINNLKSEDELDQ